MKSKLFTILASIIMLFNVSSCGITGSNGWIKIPGITSSINFGVKYQLESGLYIIVVTGEKGGIEVKLEGENEYVKSIANGYEITSKQTGVVYQVLTDDSGEVSIFIVGDNGDVTPRALTTVN